MPSNVPQTRETELNFPIEQVKKSIESIVRSGTVGYSLVDKNDIFNTYHIHAVSGLRVHDINVTLQKIDESKTKVHITNQNALGEYAHVNTANQQLDHFTGLLAKSLSGEKLTPQSVSGNSGCVLIFLVILTAIFTAVKLIA